MRLADVAEQAVERLAPDGAIVLGNSVGGFSAARLAIRRPELVRGLVIVDGGGFVGRPPHVRAFCALMARPRFLRAIYPAFSSRYMRARTDADRRARDTGVRTTRAGPRPARGERAVAQLRLARARPAPRGARHHRPHARRLGTARSRHPARGRQADREHDPRRRAGRVRQRPRPPHDRPARVRRAADPVRRSARSRDTARQRRITQPVVPWAISRSSDSANSRPSAVAVRLPLWTTRPSASTRPVASLIARM